MPIRHRRSKSVSPPTGQPDLFMPGCLMNIVSAGTNWRYKRSWVQVKFTAFMTVFALTETRQRVSRLAAGGSRCAGNAVAVRSVGKTSAGRSCATDCPVQLFYVERHSHGDTFGHGPAALDDGFEAPLLYRLGGRGIENSAGHRIDYL